MFSTQILIEVEVEVEVVKPHFKVNTKARMVDKETLEEEEVMKVMVEVIEVNNQIVTQIATIVRNLGTW